MALKIVVEFSFVHLPKSNDRTFSVTLALNAYATFNRIIDRVLIFAKDQHSRMRRQSSCLVSATNKNSAIGVLFDVHYDVIVRKYCFQRGSTLKFLKNF